MPFVPKSVPNTTRSCPEGEAISFVGIHPLLREKGNVKPHAGSRERPRSRSSEEAEDLLAVVNETRGLSIRKVINASE
jgi:hypothetical protein